LPELSPAERSALRARAHKLHPVVLIGEAGLSEAVLAEIDRNLLAHELIKIRISHGERAERARLLDAICSRLDARPVQQIGKILVVFRTRPEEPERIPRPPRRKQSPPRRATKRSFQNR
jgi:RNA-binding protein